MDRLVNKLRSLMFRLLFTEREKTAIINALYRRFFDNSTAEIDGDKDIKLICKKIADEWIMETT